MSRRTRSSIASACSSSAAAGSLPADASADAADKSLVNSTTQLLTPETSHSGTPSTCEHALDLEKSEKPSRRSSTRVTRASLRGGLTKLTDEDKARKWDSDGTSVDLKNRTISGETLIGFGQRDNASQSSLLEQTLAVMDMSWSQTTLPQEAQGEPHDLQSNDAKSESFSNKQDDSSVSTPLQTSPKRSGRIQTKKEKDAKEADETLKSPQVTPRDTPKRRSSRLSLLEKATGMLDRATSTLGKRSRDMMGKGKELSRRASLRPRDEIKAPEPLADFGEGPLAKKRRVSDTDALKVKPEETRPALQQDEFTIPRKPLPRKPKRWLTHGLYSGQPVPTDSKRGGAKNRRKSANDLLAQKPRKLLPLPIYAGDRLLDGGRDFKLPFDIFSPLPWGQPKPDEWRKTNKNVFVGDAASFWKANKVDEMSTCMCTPETGCDEDCQNRYMFYECDAGNCKLGAADCGNRNFEGLRHRTKAGGKYNIGVEVIKTDDRGYGVRGNRTFEPNQIIVEYTGEIITQEECERRMRTLYKDNECYYLMYFDQNMIIDATRGSIARFVNHSCEPNCRMEKWTVAGKPRMALFAGDRGIMTGEELTYDYNFDPYSQKNVQECRCGAENCRGVLGPRPKETKPKVGDAKKPTKGKKGSKSTIAGTKRKIGQVLDESTSRLNKKRKTLTPTVKAGVKRVISKARASTAGKGKIATTRKTTKTTAKAKVQVSKAKPKAGTKASPTVKTTVTKTKRTVSASSGKLNRPSSKTKTQLKAGARKLAQGSSALKKLTAPKQSATKKTSPKKVPTKNITPKKPSAKKVTPKKAPLAKTAKAAPKQKAGASPISRTKSKESTKSTVSRRSSVKTVAQNVVNTVKGSRGGRPRTIRPVES